MVMVGGELRLDFSRMNYTRFVLENLIFRLRISSPAVAETSFSNDGGGGESPTVVDLSCLGPLEVGKWEERWEGRQDFRNDRQRRILAKI